MNSIDYTLFLFHVNYVTRVCHFCIPPEVAKDVIEIVHGQRHPSFANSYEIVSRFWCIRGLTKLLRSYIHHCPEILILQTRRHSLYGLLEPIESPLVLFHTFTIDFILALPVSGEGFNNVMSVTCKYSKQVTLVLGKNTWSAEECAWVLLSRLKLIDWNLPAVLISDRNPKFLSKLWAALFTKLKVELLHSTAYHPQTDNFSGKINQTVEIVLCFHVYSIPNMHEWTVLLLRIQSLLHNRSFFTTRK